MPWDYSNRRIMVTADLSPYCSLNAGGGTTPHVVGYRTRPFGGSRHSGRFNRPHKVDGHLFGGRHESIVVDGSGTGYLKTVCDCVHLNPARAKLLRINQPLQTFAWSSWPLYLIAPSKRPAWLYVKELPGEQGIRKDSTAGRRELERRVEAHRSSGGAIGSGGQF